MKILRFLNDNIERYLLILTLSIMAVFILIQVFMRYCIQSSLTWSEEFIRWTFVWFIWIGISYGFKVKRHVSIPMLVDLLPPKARIALSLIANLVMTVFFLLLFFYGMKQVLSPMIMRRSAITLYWPFTDIYVSSMWQYASMPAGALLSSFRLIQNSIGDFMALRGDTSGHAPSKSAADSKAELAAKVAAAVAGPHHAAASGSSTAAAPSDTTSAAGTSAAGTSGSSASGGSATKEGK